MKRKQKIIKEKRFDEWGHLLRKKRLLQTKDYGEWGHTFGMKKNPQEIVSEDILQEKNKRLSKKKGLASEDIYWEKKKYYKQKILVSENKLLG